ncbi:MAG TPA: 5'/3'-nucleotidase SurE [Anaerolineales bacterium]|jgi:5'-nucleotidase
MKIVDVLITNDDGYKSAAYLALIKMVSKNFSTLCVAPKKKSSWISKALSYNKNVSLKKVTKNNCKIIIVDGTPADCVQLGIYHLSPSKPKLILSGINLGNNLGIAKILSSGTIGAAIEGVLAGVPAVAVSIDIPQEVTSNENNFYNAEKQHNFDIASKVTCRFVEFILTHYPDDILVYSLNIPFHANLETNIRIVNPSNSRYGSLFVKQGSSFKLLGYGDNLSSKIDDDDIRASLSGSITVSPITLPFYSGMVDHFKMNTELNAFWGTVHKE